MFLLLINIVKKNIQILENKSKKTKVVSNKCKKKEILNKWFILNIENPYPCKQTKIDLATKTNTSIDYINEWFKYQRKKLKKF